MKTSKTDDKVFKDVQSFTDDIGRKVITLYKEQPAYVLNTLLVPFLRAGVQLYATGVATPDDIDIAWKIGRRLPFGPFNIIDRVGVRTLYNIYYENFANSDLETDRKVLEIIKEMVDKNEVGRESNIGFYDYRDGDVKSRNWPILD